MPILEAVDLFLKCSYDEAFVIFENAAREGEKEAFYFLGEYFEWGYGQTVKDSVKAFEYRKEGTSRGDVLCTYKYALSLPRGSFEKYRIFRKVVPEMISLAQEGNLFAQYELVECYASGYGVLKDPNKGKEWLEIAANNNYAKAINKLGNAYYSDTYGEKDYKKATELYRRAMNMGLAVAFYNYAGQLVSGNGVDKNIDEALIQYQKSYDLGHAFAAREIADIYINGNGVPENKEKAIEWYIKGAMKGDSESQFLLGKMYENGTNVDVDYDKALFYYEKSVTQSHAKALNNLAGLYRNGKGVAENDDKAEKLYHEAAKNGSNAARDNVRLYLTKHSTKNSYTVSEDIKRKIRQIPEFKTDLSKIKSVSDVRNTYGISAGETIIAYRVVPKLLAKLETGGTVFTDKGVYRRLPSGLLSNDYVTYGISYDEMIHYLPAMDYSQDNQPQLVGKHEGREDLSFWMTPIAGTESNSAIVGVLWDIISEMCANSPEKQCQFIETERDLIYDCNYQYNDDETIDYGDKNIIEELIKRNLLGELKDNAVYLTCAYSFSIGGFKSGIESIKDYLNESCHNQLKEDIDFLIKNKIDHIGYPDSSFQVGALEELCDCNNAYVPEVLPRIVDYCFDHGEFHSIDSFIDHFNSTEYYAAMKQLLTSKIEAVLPLKISDWKQNVDSHEDEDFILYAMKNTSTYKTAAKAIVQHYCENGKFEEVVHRIDEIKEVENDKVFIDELQLFIKDNRAVYALKQFEKGQEYILVDDNYAAYDCFKEAVKYNPDNQEFVIALIDVLIKLNNYGSAKKYLYDSLEKQNVIKGECSDKYRELKVEYIKHINEEMRVYYDRLVADKEAELSNEALIKVDQLGLTPYHYAALLHHDTALSSVEFSEARREVHGFDILSFGAGKRENSMAYKILVRDNDEDGIKLLKEYRKKKAVNTVKNIGRGLVNAIFDYSLEAAQNAETKLSHMEKRGGYSDSDRDRISDMHDQALDTIDRYKEAKEGFEDRTSGLFQSNDELLDDFYDAISDLAETKLQSYYEGLDKCVTEYIGSKLIYLIIKEPDYLRQIFHGDMSKFQLYETEKDFWYLPEDLIKKAEAVQSISNEKKEDVDNNTNNNQFAITPEKTAFTIGELEYSKIEQISEEKIEEDTSAGKPLEPVKINSYQSLRAEALADYEQKGPEYVNECARKAAELGDTVRARAYTDVYWDQQEGMKGLVQTQTPVDDYESLRKKAICDYLQKGSEYVNDCAKRAAKEKDDLKARVYSEVFREQPERNEYDRETGEKIVK